MPSNDKPSLKDLELLLDNKLKPIHSRQDDIFKKGPKLWNELDEKFKCSSSSQLKKELTSHSLVSINLC